MQPPPEHLGSFYLGAEYDLQSGKSAPFAFNYEARDLTTHAVCVGMTGSGKTGLCMGLLEEAAMDNVPAILIDPKGDISNLLLQFPNLAPQDFAPWVNQADAQHQGQTVVDYAADVADYWRQGLAAWGIDASRIRNLKETVDYTIYTPGSDAGLSINILGSLAAPQLDFDQHTEIIRERIDGVVNALLGLVGITADPIQSREAILLSNIFEHVWRQNQDLDLAKLILFIQQPPVRQLGVLDVDTFFPQKERFELAMAFNNLVAAPKFQNWLQGDALNIDALLYTDEGKPRHSIFYLGHLPDKERMFFVTLLLETMLTWVHRQTGTQSLRAILYFDEVFGYLPPVAQPSSKRLLMSLLKQGRAVGLGCVLATQNPGDVDYKALTNAGTWFIGRLQTERDRERVIDGLKNAIAETGGDAQRVDYHRIIGQLGPRTFLMHSVHHDRPVVFQTRWAMSYLHGPLTRPQIQALMKKRKEQLGASPAADTQAAFTAQATPVVKDSAPPPGYSLTRQVLAPEIPQLFLPVTANETLAIHQAYRRAKTHIELEQAQLVYEPAIIGSASVRFLDQKQNISQERERLLLTGIPGQLDSVDWDRAVSLSIPLGNLRPEPEQVASGQGPFFAAVPEGANSPAELKSIASAFADWLYYNSEIKLLAHPELNVIQHPEESEQQFKARLRQAARELRDAGVDKLRNRYEDRIEKLEARLRRYERDLEQDEADYHARKRESLIATGEMMLTLFSKRRGYRTFSWTASRRRMANLAKMEVEETEAEINEIETELADLQNELNQQIEAITPRWVDILKKITAHTVRPRRADVDVKLVGLAWVPLWVIRYSADGKSLSTTIPAYAIDSN